MIRNTFLSYKIHFLITFVCLLVFLATSDTRAQETKLGWESFEEALTLAKEDDKLIFVDVWAPWCGWCKKMRDNVYPELSEKLSDNFVLTRINRDDNNSKKRYQDYTYTPLRLAQKLNVDTVPGIIFLDSKGNYVAHITGYQDVDDLKQVLDIVLD